MKNIYKGLLMSSAMVGAAISVSSKANADQVTVKSGDTLSQIANKAGTTVESLKINNNLQDVNKIYTGQEIKVDNNAQSSVKTYTVKAGDSLWKIAQANGLSVDELKSVNHLTGNLILVGQVLNLEKGQSQDNTQAQTQAPSDAQDNTQAQASQTQAQTPYQQVQQTQTQIQNRQNLYNWQAKQSANNVQSNVQASANSGYTSNVSGSDQAAKAWIAQRESSNNYNARNGQYIGKYQLSSSYLNGDYSPANQERVADQYVTSRYGSWTGAQQFWQSHGWY
ncbi:LysM peptidoglycan-binding domain-containing protein [Ligilactobacillus salivarius]|uniref:LysM domain-containing protein n=1 Tax=Ligilactobacillus salivarius TaxID=1624 RepID=A0A9X6XJ79_9LACO|nr:LysM peptidoglycan-binding domain-containing protein [Ligilactobacillus salivarius]OTF88499.1 hypothetical protein A8C38_10585 [Ligilactobacillus salivarius]PAY27927.1 hypothetical protein A8C33_05195 [Ligilactobacillus salivarius]PAY29284.1 hypothetical protein A8C44_02200 [Ligilactobacillus salivarius]PAY30126.1 hypothetical protein A8C49_04845 [Ligilactobacillus salivarius]PAY34277.1 hypothetical protein A8C50_01135 [Ligilactobacillus salivarius]